MPLLQDQFLRETILKTVAGEGVLAADLPAIVERALHPKVFPAGSAGLIPQTLAELHARGLVRQDGASVRRATADDGAWMLSQWWDALGGLTPIDATLHRAPLPYAPEHFARLRAAGIGVVYSFEGAVPGERAREAGLDWRPHFWEDNGRPSVAEMDAFLADLAVLPRDARVVVHCKAGLGRTGMAVACALAQRHGWDADRALAHYWARVPLARDVMEAYGQAEFVRAYLARRGALSTSRFESA